MPEVRSHSRFAAVIAFLRRRLSAEGYLGLHLTIGAAVLSGALWVFGEITEGVVVAEPFTRVDRVVAGLLRANATPGWDKFMFGVSFFGSAAFLGTVTGVAALVLVCRRSWYRLHILLLVVPGGTLINVVVKLLIQRQRPVFEHPLITLDSYSFPSGHAMGATLFYGLMAAFAVLESRRWRWKVSAVLGAAAVVLWVGFSRIWLGLHYVSDVLGAMAAGVAWLALCLTAMETFRRRRVHRGRAAKG